MDLLDLIYTKRSGGILSPEQIHFLVQGVVEHKVDREQLSALLMAIYLQGMDTSEISELTEQMATQGHYFAQGSFGNAKVVDKHSTGGVGDKVSLVLIPLMAAVGIPVAKLSGRGLGHTGGTLDKLEIFSGFQTDLSVTDFQAQVKTHGMAISGQTDELVPADKILYALRDVTGTVESLPLIASSIMSKKIATGADAILLDVKVGSGATLGNEEEARKLAELMIAIGNKLGRKTEAFLTNMQQPLGYAVGNLLEAREAYDTLRGEGPSDLTELSLQLAKRAVLLSSIADDEASATTLVSDKLNSGAALEKLVQLIGLQGGDTTFLTTNTWPSSPLQKDLHAQESGFVSQINSRAVGEASMLAGAGRRSKDDIIDPLAGLVLSVKVGDRVTKGDSLCTIYSNDAQKMALAAEKVADAFHFTERECDRLPVILDFLQ